MAFELAQTINFGDVRHTYDRAGDVLYLSFGQPVPAAVVQVEDWLALRISITPPALVGMTIVGFRAIFRKIRPYIERELPGRIERLATLSMSVRYDEEKDALVIREERTGPGLSLFEPLAPNLYVEKTVPSKDVVGIKIMDFTRQGPEAIKTMFGLIVDTLFDPMAPRDENADLITKAVMRRFDWRTLAQLAA
jgi:hypothetical protein